MLQSPITYSTASMALAMHDGAGRKVGRPLKEKNSMMLKTTCGTAATHRKSTDAHLGESKSPKSPLETQASVDTNTESSRSCTSGIFLSDEDLSVCKQANTRQQSCEGTIRTPAVDLDVLPSVARKSMTTFISDDLVNFYGSCSIDADNLASKRENDPLWFEKSLENKCSCSPAGSGAASPPKTHRNLLLEMQELMEQMEEKTSGRDLEHPNSHTSNASVREATYISQRDFCGRVSTDDKFASAESASTVDSDESFDELEEEIEEIISFDDMLLNNMERQWCGRDFLMERMEEVAAMNSQDGESLPSQHYESF